MGIADKLWVPVDHLHDLLKAFMLSLNRALATFCSNRLTWPFLICRLSRASISSMSRQEYQTSSFFICARSSIASR